jgi:hypothetical protein
MTEVMSNELIYSSRVSTHSQPLFRKITPQGSATNISLSVSGTTLVEMVVPPSVMNLAKSRLNFQLELPDPGASVSVNCIDANLLTTLSRVVVYCSNTGNTLLDCSNFEKYASVIVPASTSYDEFKTKSSNWQSATYAQKAGIADTDSNPFPLEDIHKSNSLVNVTPLNTAAAGTSGFNSFEGRRYVLFGTDSEKTYLNVSLPFSAFKFTALSLDKMLYSPANLIFQFYFSPLDSFAWEAASVTDPSSTAVSLASGILNSVSLQLYTESNLEIAKSVVDAVMGGSGIQVPIPYPTLIRQSLSSSTFQSYNVNLSSAYGKRILAIVNSLFSVGSTAKNAVNSHIRGTINTYNTFMNNVPVLYNAGFDCRLGEDWFYGNRHLLDRSTIQNNQEYAVAEWVHIDNFMPPKPLHEQDPTQQDGYDVSSIASTYSVQYNLSSAATAIAVTAVIGQKIATFSNNGVLVN